MNNGLKDKYSKFFDVGASVNREVLTHKQADEVLKRHFSTITTENSMKFGPIQPEETRFNWEETDIIANYARKSGFTMRGHTMLWHNQNPNWLFLDGDKQILKTKLLKRLENHCIAVTERYNDIVKTWDVVNEVIDTDKGDENNMRITDWYKICGIEAYEYAFKLMRELSPDAKLYYNDYNNESGSKLEKTIQFLSSMLNKDIPIDGIGIQGHWYYNFPDEKTLRNAIERYSALGLDIEFTEVDISIYEWDEAREKEKFFTTPPLDRLDEQKNRYLELFKIASEYPAVKNITTWGIADNYTWLDNFPVKDRKNWPLLFDTNYNPKPVVDELLREL